LSKPDPTAKVDAVMSEERASAPSTSVSHPIDRPPPAWSRDREPLVALEPVAREQAPVLRNLFDFYAHDFSEHVPLDLTADGRFDVQLSEKWWTAADHFPFFIRHGGKLAGFALVRRGSRVSAAADVMDIAEFFVVRGARGRRVGTHVAHSLFTTFPGRWEIRVRKSNVAALKFWSTAIAGWCGRSVASAPFATGAVDWEVFRIEPSRG
jgi:predicted acetyltransferase